MPRMTGGQALARQLYREGVRVIFGLPGVQLYHLLDGLYEQSGIRFITTRHEQATTYMADGFSRAGGGIGTALVVPGPGLQNASAGIGTAYSASSPILVIAGQVEQDLIGVDRGVLHEINDQLDTIRPVIKWGRRILAAKDVPGSVHDAFHQLQSGRPRPVEIEIPPDTLAEEADVELVEPVDYQRPAAAAAEIQAWSGVARRRFQSGDLGRRRRALGRRACRAAAGGRAPAGARIRHRRGPRRGFGPALPVPGTRSASGATPTATAAPHMT